MLGDDLAGLFNPEQPDALRLRQGVVTAWNVLTGLGTIEVAGVQLTDLPFLSAGGIVLLVPGDVVAVVRQGGTWFILGRVVLPGGARAIGRNTQSTTAYDAGVVTDISTTTAFATKVTLTIPVPSWAEIINAEITLHVVLKNSTAAAAQFTAKILCPDTEELAWPSATIPTLATGQLTITKHWNAVAPVGSMDIVAQISSTAAFAALFANQAYLQATVHLNSNDN